MRYMPTLYYITNTYFEHILLYSYQNNGKQFNNIILKLATFNRLKMTEVVKYV